MGLLDVKTPFERSRRARLVLDLDELAQRGRTSLEDYAAVRGIASLSSARRSLFRLKETLVQEGVALEVIQAVGRISADFGTREIAELIELDVRPARVLVEKFDAVREGREPELDESVNSDEIRRDYRERKKSFAWIARKHGLCKDRIHRLLAATGPVPSPSLRRCIEERRPRALVDRALEAVARGGRVAEVAAILECTTRTAKRLLKRHGFCLPWGRPRSA